MDKEKILNLEMELSSISFKITSAIDTEKEKLERGYIEASRALKELKKGL